MLSWMLWWILIMSTVTAPAPGHGPGRGNQLLFAQILIPTLHQFYPFFGIIWSPSSWLLETAVEIASVSKRANFITFSLLSTIQTFPIHWKSWCWGDSWAESQTNSCAVWSSFMNETALHYWVIITSSSSHCWTGDWPWNTVTPTFQVYCSISS